MKYISTRGRAEKTGATRAIIKGIAEDRGLYVPEGFPRLKESWTELVSLENKEVAQLVLSCFLPDFTLEELAEYTEKAYGETFEHPRVAPLVRAG
ncbi:MAG TPA: threonine synthase, partial [Anaerovoracaceae bacterium]|nr:threonine synthase [Anaerovoracaceae bacterium]